MYVKTGFYEVGVAPGVAIRLQSVADLMRRDGLILSDTEWFLIRPQSGESPRAAGVRLASTLENLSAPLATVLPPGNSASPRISE